MRYGVIAVAVILVLLGSTARDSHGDIAYGVGSFMGVKAISGIWRLDTDTATANMLVHTPGVFWYGATDGPSPDTFYAIANPWSDHNPDPELRLPCRAELFLIDTTSWTVNSLGIVTTPRNKWPITEIGLDESTNTLYGTDYSGLYTIPIAGGPATSVGLFGTHPGTTNDIDYVFSLDYDQSVGIQRLVGTSLRRGATQADDETDLYYFNRTTGAGTRVGYTGTDFFSDVWYSHDSEKLFGVSQAPGRILEIDATSGIATQIGAIPYVNLYGMANATPESGSLEPLPYVTVPLIDRKFETYAYANVETVVNIPNVGKAVAVNPDTLEEPEIYNPDGPVDGGFDVTASFEGAEPWQNTNVNGAIDLKDTDDSPDSIPDGMLRVSAIMSATATGSDEGVDGVTRHSSVFGTVNIHGAIEIGIPEGGTPGMPVLFGASVYTWGTQMQPLWNLTIKDAVADPEVVYLPNVDEQSDTWTFSFEVHAGQILDYEFNYFGVLLEAPSGEYELFADVDFVATAQLVPEPATVLVLCSGAIPLILKKRRRRN